MLARRSCSKFRPSRWTAFHFGLALVLLMGAFCSAGASPTQALPLVQRLANQAMERWPNGHFVPSQGSRWNYDLGVLLDGMDATWYNTADKRYFQYVQHSMDALVSPSGEIPTYNASANALDNILLGRQLLLLNRVTGKKRYYKAAELLRAQLASQPVNASGGFWHKQIYPNQMWLDGLYMAEPFYAEYASVFHQSQDFPIITRQFALIEKHARDPKTGLLYHAWDASKKQSWANPVTGDSRIFWGRGMGWYMMALVDTLPYYPANDPGRAELVRFLRLTAKAVVRYQDPKSGLWYQVMNMPNAPGNYLESSASCMFTYALAKGVRLGYLPASYEENAERAWQGIKTHFLKIAPDGEITLTSTVQSIGLGGKPYRDGSYHYYVSSAVVSNDPKGIGALLLAANEMELRDDVFLGRGQTALLDGWYNSQKRLNAAGQMVEFHYKWNDYSNEGYSLFGHIFRMYGVATKTLYTAPTADALKRAQIYIIASPDNAARNPHPHYMNSKQADQIAAWVHHGGTLLIMENDKGNADIPHMDILADRFGLHFNNVLAHHVVNEDFSMGRIDVPQSHPPFSHAQVLFMKDTSSLKLSKGARPLLTSHGVILMAWARYGKGFVVAVTDPWLYNEYTDGRKPKMPSIYNNFAGGQEFVHWILEQRAKRN
jgi:unsaturated rhamnogalacturonyl hydrolase